MAPLFPVGRRDHYTCTDPGTPASRGQQTTRAGVGYSAWLPRAVLGGGPSRAPCPGRRNANANPFQGRRHRPQGRSVFVIDPVPYEIKLAQANAQLENATARLEFANRELARAQMLKRNGVVAVENVDQRTSDQQAAQAAFDDAQAQIRDARFDLDHCRIIAPFTGRIGTHLVSVGNLVAGSRAASSPTTLLATLVSLDPLYLDFDMSESDYLAFSREHA